MKDEYAQRIIELIEKCQDIELLDLILKLLLKAIK